MIAQAGIDQGGTRIGRLGYGATARERFRVATDELEIEAGP